MISVIGREGSRSGSTLVELCMVLGILAVIGALRWVDIRSMSQKISRCVFEQREKCVLSLTREQKSIQGEFSRPYAE